MKNKRIIAAVLTAVLLLGVIPFPVQAANWGQGDTLDDALSELKAAFDNTKLDWLVLPDLGVIELRYTYFLYNNRRTGTVDEHPVYCIDPTKGGAYEIVRDIGPNGDGSNTATYIRGEKVGDAKYRGILAMGYPHMQLTGLGLQTREEKYYATKLALWMYIRGNDPAKLGINPKYGNNDPVAPRVRDAAVWIYNNGLTNMVVDTKLSMTGTPDATAKLNAAGDYYIQEIEVYASAWVGTDGKNIGDVQLSWDSPPPAGTTVLGSSGEDITGTLAVKMGTRSGKTGWFGKATVKYPAAGIDAASYSPPALKANGVVTNDAIYIAYAKVNKDKYQRYLVEGDPKIELTASFVSQFDAAPFDEDTPKNTGLRIRKIQAGTNTPLAGAVFEIRDPAGRLIYSMATNSSGIIDIPLAVTGNYTATEVSPPQYHLPPDNKTQSVMVNYGKTAEVTFTNAPYGTLRVVKRDAANGMPLGGASIRIRNITTNTVQERVGDSSGSAVFECLPAGAYEISEIAAPEGYALDSAVHTVNVLPLSQGETSYTLTDKALPGLRIVKFDRQTMRPVAGVSFEIWRDGELRGIYQTDVWGRIELRGLPPGTYLAKETATVPPYILDTTAQWVELRAGQGYISELMFFNLERPGINLIKIDRDTFEPLPGARFLIKQTGGAFAKEFITGQNGAVNLSGLEPGAYTVGELSAPPGWLIDESVRTVQLTGGENAQFVFTNTRKPKLRILKVDVVTGKPLANAEFRIRKAEDAAVSEYITGESGEILIENLEVAVYRAEEFMPADGYIRFDGSKEIMLEGGKTKTLKFDNIRKPVAVFVKTNALTGKGIPGATFTVEYEQPGGGLQNLGSYKTGSDGRIMIPKAEPGWYVFTETLPASGFSLPENPVTRMYCSPGDNAYLPEFERLYSGGAAAGSAAGTTIAGNAVPKQIQTPSPAVSASGIKEHPGSVYYKEGGGFNWPLNSIVIKKTHAVTGELLAGAVFELFRADEQVSGVPGTAIGRYTTGSSGVVVITGLAPGYYIVKEVQPPQNFLISENSQQNGFLKADGTTVLEFSFANVPYGSLLISKVDALTGEPLAGARFKVTDASGAVVGNTNGEYVTDSRGEILIPNIKPGAAVVTEIEAPPNYAVNTTPQTVQIGTDGKIYKTSFENYPYSTVVIRKLDSVTHKPLTGAEFMVTDSAGGAVGSSNGIFITDIDGLIRISGVPEGSYIITEKKSLPTHVLDAESRTIAVENDGRIYTLDFFNTPLPGLQIRKISSENRQPVENVEFSVDKLNGEHVGTYKTDKSGLIYAELEPGHYTVTEKKADGYVLDAAPRTVEIKAGGKPVTLEIINTPLSGLLIVKTDGKTGKPLEGVVFDVTRADGQRVSGNIQDGNQPGTEANSPNRTISPDGGVNGSYTTDSQGRILINSLPSGEYHVTERKPLEDYALDTEVHSVTVTPGKLAALQLTNTQKAGLRLIKIDSITKKGIYNAEFMLFDSGNKAVGTYYTDNNGVIDFSGVIPEGRYTIRETCPAPDYYNDGIPRTVEFKAGRMTEVRWENTPKTAQIQIFKKSGDDNEVNGLPAGSPLAGAVFEAYEYKSGNMADRFVSGADGRAVSRPLPLGRYAVKEVQSPQYYRLSTQSLDIDLEFAGQTVKQEFLNYSANTGVYIKKTGPAECMPGDTVRYDIRAVQNTSTVPLTDFYWRDTLPADAARLSKIVTGTFNQPLKYKVMITTNKGGSRVIADNLSTVKNNVIDCSNASLGLYNDEYVVSVTFIFGTVKAGFAQAEQPQIYAKTLTSLPNGYPFANKADTGGKYGREWVTGNSACLTVIYKKSAPLPRTGY